MRQSIPEPIQTLWHQAIEIWLSGGYAMIAIAIVAFIMFSIGIHIYLRLMSKGFGWLREQTWRRWIDHPNERRGPIGEIIEFVTGGESLRDNILFFQELQVLEIVPIERDLRVMKICVSAAPLLGLLGTVIGMLATFNALSSGSGVEKTMEMIAAGISEALITTETGLVIAIPGLLFQYQLTRKLDQYKAFLARLETVCAQKIYRNLRKAELNKAPH